jgi:hypothetical protein
MSIGVGVGIGVGGTARLAGVGVGDWPGVGGFFSVELLRLCGVGDGWLLPIFERLCPIFLKKSPTGFAVTEELEKAKARRRKLAKSLFIR